MKTKFSVKQSETGEDRISDLPDEVIAHILSLMPTEDAVRTSVLARDWEYKWTTIYNVDITESAFYKGGTSNGSVNMESFVNFVERILRLTPVIESFSLSMSCHAEYEEDLLTAWINAVMMRNVKNLEVWYGGEDIVLPCELFHNTSLRTLALDIPCPFRVPASCSFPYLESLELSSVDIVNVSGGDTLVLAFPVLEEMILANCDMEENVKVLEIHAPCMSTLSYAPFGRTTDCLFKIFSTSLVEFVYEVQLFGGGGADDFIFIGQQVVCAKLSYENDDEDDHKNARKFGLLVRKLLKEFSSLKKLALLNGWAEAIVLKALRGSHPICCHKLIRLQLDCCLSIDCEGERLLELLKFMPFLKFLEISVNFLDEDYVYDAVENVPLCIKDALEEVKFDGYNSALAKFLLKNGRKLKKFEVRSEEAIKELSTLPKCSTSLTFVLG